MIQLGSVLGKTQERSSDVLDSLFGAESVAIIGASNDPNKLAGRPLAYMLRSGFDGAIYPINPSRSEVQGQRCYPDLASLGAIPEIAVIAVPAAHVERAVEDCAEAGVNVAIIMSAGFAETGSDGAAVQNRLRRIARARGMRLLGPNCLGTLNAETGLCTSFSAVLSRGFPSPGPVGIVSQSGAYGAHVLHLTSQRGIGIRYWITTGNEADIDVADAIDWMAHRPEVKVILAYVEGVRDGAKFLRALQAAHESKTPVVLLKTGSSVDGARAAGSHTGALAGSDAVFDQVLRQHGVYRAHSIDEQLDVVYACVRTAPIRGRDLGIVTMSGGVGAYLCDAAERHGLLVPQLPVEAQSRMKKLLPYASVANPVDCTAQVLQQMDLLTASFETLISGGQFDAIVAFFSTVPLDPQVADAVRHSVEEGTAHRGACPVVICMVASTETIRSFEESGFLVFEDPYRAVRAIGALSWFGASFDRPVHRQSLSGESETQLTGRFSEQAVKAILQNHGIPVIASQVVTSADEAWVAASAMGLPVALKVESEDIAHKSAVGGVALHLDSESAVRAAYRSITTSVREALPGASVSGVSVSSMAPEGIETIIGMSRDQIFGPIVMLGLGGIHVELLGDVSLRLPPVDLAEAHSMIDDLRGSAILTGTRGAEPADCDALASALVALSQFVDVHHEVETVEVNPFVVWPSGATALDGVLTLSNQHVGESA